MKYYKMWVVNTMRDSAVKNVMIDNDDDIIQHIKYLIRDAYNCSESYVCNVKIKLNYEDQSEKIYNVNFNKADKKDNNIKWSFLVTVIAKKITELEYGESLLD